MEMSVSKACDPPINDPGHGVVLGMYEPQPTGIHWLNPFTGKSEPWYSDKMAVTRQLIAAAERINELQAEIDEIKSFLVMD